MPIHVCPSTIDAIEQAVDEMNGVALISNRRIKRLERKDRLRMERLRRVFELVRRRGLECYPRNPSWPDEWCTFTVYRPGLLSVDLAAVAADTELMAAMDCVMKGLRHPYWHSDAPASSVMCRELRKLAAAETNQIEANRRRLRAA
ncbi:hypothetical protein QCN29_02185 [Streptomyces sp. HNM0663]|uniref:Uncharacterized protein n=1 Tax=Streptomyces chengmaiensis TaxID=3040919 RepID=A0ABT6HFR9_9ACTN|nr:hypothetical protein [Streptomyces chengmaiensis]MDH2387614.1 hypothetical protein [Streptomyces chengmaiensis]